MISLPLQKCQMTFLNFDSFVSLMEKAEDQCPVKVLRDTAYSQSLILSGVLPLGATLSCNVGAVVRGIEMDFMPAPLHHVHVQSKLITGFFPVAFRSCFLINGIDFIMGNDIAGGKDSPFPEVCDTPTPEHDDLAHCHPGVFTDNVVTHAQAHKHAQEVQMSNSLSTSDLTEDRMPHC